MNPPPRGTTVIAAGFRSHAFDAVIVGIALAAALLLLQILPASGSFRDAVHGLFQWDSAWYENIAIEGYHSEGLRAAPEGLDMEQENIAFFPAYPLFGRFLAIVLRLPVGDALLLASFLACALFWTYVVLLLRSWKVPFPLGLGAVALLFAFPSAYYLVAAYSESLFYAALLGFLYWSAKTEEESWLLAAAHGFVMSASRVVGLPLVVVPLMQSLCSRKRGGKPLARRRTVFSPAPLALVAALGGLSFFLFTALRFGAWDVYFQTQRIGWGVAPAWIALLKPATYQLQTLFPHLPTFDDFGLLTVPLSLLWLLLLLVADVILDRRRHEEGWRERIGLYFCAAALFFVALAGTAAVHMMSITRYIFGVHLFLTLATVHLLAHCRLSQRTLTVLCIGALLLAAFLLRFQAAFSDAFMRGEWVA